jgi:two-component system, response regulator YesN
MEIGIWVSEDEALLLQEWRCRCEHRIVPLHSPAHLQECIRQRQVQLLIVSTLSLPHEYLQEWCGRIPPIDWIAVTRTPSYAWAEAVMLGGASAFCSLPTTPQHIDALIDHIRLRRNYRLHAMLGMDISNAAIDLSKPIESAIIYIAEHLSEHITLRDVSQAVYLSPSHFSRLFAQKVGTPFNEYLLTRRIDTAKALLSETHLPIELIAAKIGMNSASQFSQTFKRVTTLSPRAYRHASTSSNQTYQQEHSLLNT